MLKWEDFEELEKLVETMVKAERETVSAIEQHCSDEFWKRQVADVQKKRSAFWKKLYSMRAEV